MKLTPAAASKSPSYDASMKTLALITVGVSVPVDETVDETVMDCSVVPSLVTGPPCQASTNAVLKLMLMQLLNRPSNNFHHDMLPTQLSGYQGVNGGCIGDVLRGEPS